MTIQDTFVMFEKKLESLSFVNQYNNFYKNFKFTKE